jgi:hypothetical protein
MDEKPRNLKAMISEANDTSEIMIDLADAALFFSDAGMADEVLDPTKAAPVSPSIAATAWSKTTTRDRST